MTNESAVYYGVAADVLVAGAEGVTSSVDK